MKYLLFIIGAFLVSCQSDKNIEFIAFSNACKSDSQLVAILQYLDIVSTNYDSISYDYLYKLNAIGVSKSMYTSTYYMAPDFKPPSGVKEIMKTREISTIFINRFDSCVVVNFRKYSDNTNRYLIYHSRGLGKCNYFKSKLRYDSELNCGYINISKSFSLYIHK